jgi:hypothetical protein
MARSDFRLDLESSDVGVAFVGIKSHKFPSDFDVRKTMFHPVVDCSLAHFVSTTDPRLGKKFWINFCFHTEQQL